MKTKRLRFLALALTATMALGACNSEVEQQTIELPTLASADGAESDDAGSGDDAEADKGELSEADQERAFAEYDACMADAGIDISGFIGGEGSEVESIEAEEAVEQEPFDPEAFDEATRTCDKILEDAFGSFEMTPEQEAELADQMLEMQRCLSEKGFEIDTTGGSFELDEDIDIEAFDEAMSACGNDFEIGSDQ